jgi:hypothetical protein
MYYRERGLAGQVFIVMMAIVLACVIGGALWWFVFDKPVRDNAFNHQVQGIISEYCTAPHATDREYARQDLKQLEEGKPDLFKSLPDDLRYTAQNVINNDYEGACR